MVAVEAAYPFDDASDHRGGLLGHLEIIHVSGYCHLESANVFVDDASVVWIDGEAFLMKVPP